MPIYNVSANVVGLVVAFSREEAEERFRKHLTGVDVESVNAFRSEPLPRGTEVIGQYGLFQLSNDSG